MLGKIDEVTKEIEKILKQFLIDHRFDVNLEEPSQDTSIKDIHVTIPDKQKDQSSEKATLKEKPGVQTTDNINDFGATIQDPLAIKVVSEKTTEETMNMDKDKDDGEKGEKDEIADKEKGEEKAY